VSLSLALLAAHAGDRARALSLAHAFTSDSRCVGKAASVCGRLLFGLGDVEAAIEALERPSGGADLPRLLEYRSLFGRYREAILGLPSEASAETHARAADVLTRRGDATGAIRHLRRACDLEPRSARLKMALADALGATSGTDELTSLLEDVLTEKKDDPTYLGAAARMALGAGAFPHARTFAERLLRVDARAGAAHDVLGHLALFRGESDDAVLHAEALLAASEPALGLTIRGGALALGGRDDAAALAFLERANLEDDHAWEAHAWRAEILLRRRALDAAANEADRAISEAQGFLLSARIVRVLARFGSSEEGRRRPAGAAYREAEFLEIEQGVHLLCPAARGRTDGDARIRLLEEALRALRGNRTLHGSRVDGNELVSVPAVPGPRWASRQLLGRIATSDEEVLFSDFARVIAAHPHSGLPLCHRGEVHLWLGHYEAARADLETVVDRFPYSRWAYIGLAALETIEGKPERALEVLARGVDRMDQTTGPGVHGVRGEALRKLGRPTEAIGPLEEACALSPRRVSASANLALAYEAVGRAEDARRVFTALTERAYPFLHDAALAIGADLDDARALAPILEQALRQALGNRSASVITWRVGDAPIRCLTDISSAQSIGHARERELSSVLQEATRRRI